MRFVSALTCTTSRGTGQSMARAWAWAGLSDITCRMLHGSKLLPCAPFPPRIMAQVCNLRYIPNHRHGPKLLPCPLPYPSSHHGAGAGAAADGLKLSAATSNPIHLLPPPGAGAAIQGGRWRHRSRHERRRCMVRGRGEGGCRYRCAAAMNVVDPWYEGRRGAQPPELGHIRISLSPPPSPFPCSPSSAFSIEPVTRSRPPALCLFLYPVPIPALSSPP